MKLALVGTGMIIKEVLPVLKEIKSIDLMAIVSTPRSLEIAEALADAFGIQQASCQLAEVLKNEEVDTVYVAIPNHLHFEVAKQALEAGKHVICEKPFTMTAKELDTLSSIARAKQLILLEAITNQYLPNTQFIKEHLTELGDIKLVECNYSQYSSRYDAFQRGEIAPAFDPKKGGGALRDLNIYNIHLLVGLFGKPKTVQYLANMERQVDTSGVLLMDYERFKAVCIGAKDCSAEIVSTIQGNKGFLSVLGAPNAVPELLLAIRGEQARTVNLNHSSHRMYDEFVAFSDIISNKNMERAEQALEHSKAVMAVLEQAAASLESNS
ncbi:TPA: Gfo/Idh/MocA family oxidoreductase [Streptococcus equi subsp. zooepidemicus]|nr:Gfo/Idh/MocA family oxidoreductase [Streptococcus equi subsp. zooepidemicus]HEK9999440.1 Gfo/Idh/MocA family oxidoreductase [Streptococcus equi subsp. zooepidemicus]HEL0414380.1 Gfo/Idh/MocA family oxidoreductase [Streptococcus equi subsp. zooepidemicus]HEL0428652.1 Gfo/Idh/MocA family oxidoreductase [Streptococcus equi subsp. zooepidemicus]HEL0430846.1 Gfo/Idh/MocA family oxidoreductase [Streptococcus equi subsp. zooepidemicus]